ncbi:F-box family protein with DUF295 [Prunus dulcis]|uniref:F-box family protein with DUF295 n=1 Tax=Prunus dulcis TaxID=3755 RepID=A0A5H2XJK2_PRUDU|nr:F-box family protein with DUF295 [Prunus dulcis]
MINETAAQLDISVIIQIFLKEFILKTTPYPFILVITQSWTDVYGHPVRFQLVSALDLPHEFRGRSDRECQDLRLGRLGVPRPARIAARLTLCPRDLPGLRIRLTTVPCILPERLKLTWCHRGICRAGQADHSPLISPVCGSGIDTFIFVQLCKNITFVHSHFQPVFRPQAAEVRGIHHRAILSFRVSSQGDSVEFSAEV